MKLFVLFILALLPLSGFSQNNRGGLERAVPAGGNFLEEEPKFNYEKCTDSEFYVNCFREYIKDNISIPDSAVKEFLTFNPENTRARARIGFIIELDSTVNMVNITIPGYGTQGLYKEIKSIIESSEYWIPGKKNGKAVRTSIAFSYGFKSFSKQ